MKFKKRIREATDVCLRELKESNKSRFDSYSVRNSVLIISHITFRDCHVHIFSDNLSRNAMFTLVDVRVFHTRTNVNKHKHMQTMNAQRF